MGATHTLESLLYKDSPTLSLLRVMRSGHEAHADAVRIMSGCLPIRVLEGSSSNLEDGDVQRSSQA